MFLLLLKLLVSGFPPRNLLLSKVSGIRSHSATAQWCLYHDLVQSEWDLLFGFYFPFSFFPFLCFGYRNTLHRSLWGPIKERPSRWIAWVLTENSEFLKLGENSSSHFPPPNHIVSEDPVISSHPFADLIPQNHIICSMWTCITHPYSR